MNVDTVTQKEIVRILAEIFPGVLIYHFSSKTLNTGPSEGKQPAIHLALDLGRIIGQKDVMEAQRALAQTSIPYTVYLFDLNGVSQKERADIIASAQAWKIGL